jgi:ATP-dependent RNA helicase UAP56/SUB2
MKNHIELLKGLKPPHIVVGTLGRVLALVKEKHLNLDNLKMFVLDECDKVLESMTMRSDVQKNLQGNPSLQASPHVHCHTLRGYQSDL